MANATYHLRGTNSTGAPLSVDILTDNGSSDSNAKTVAQSLSTLLGTAVTLFAADGVTVIEDVTPGTQSGSVSVVVCSTISAL